MKKIILSFGMLIAIATAGFAQSNVSTVNQTTGDRNTADVTQKGRANKTEVTQIDLSTTDNKAIVKQTGEGNVVTVGEKGKRHVVDITQNNVAFPSGVNTATVQISGAASNTDSVTVIQTGKSGETYAGINGNNNTIKITQAGDTNKGLVGGDFVAGNDGNKVTLVQTGKLGEAWLRFDGDNNTIGVDQDGDKNSIGKYAGGAQPITTVTFTTQGRTGTSIAKPFNGTVTSLPVFQGVNINGDRNEVSLRQEAGTRDNTIGVDMVVAGSNSNKVTIKQLDQAVMNEAVVRVFAGGDNNTATIEQKGANAKNNKAGISFEGDLDIATITQTGLNNKALIVAKATTVSGSNNATITQSGNFNEGLIIQEGTFASTAILEQVTNNNFGEIYQEGNGGNYAKVRQESTVMGSRFVVEQAGTGNFINAIQRTPDGITKSDIEIKQTGMNNRVEGTLLNSGAAAVISGTLRINQTGNNNLVY